MSYETLITLTMYAYNCDRKYAETLVSAAEQGGTLNDLIIYVSLKR